jgi:protein-S-isoprenylcysteine O-methyltransferase Ste14
MLVKAPSPLVILLVGFSSQLGSFFQVKADFEKHMFRSDPTNKDTFITTGVWSLSRHPNYFGEITMWWGIWISATSTIFDGEDIGASAVTILSPVYTMLILLFVSGLPFAEGAALERYYRAPDRGQKWDKYRLQTSPVIPMPCGLYAKIPLVIKRYLLFEFKFLEYSPSTERDTPAKPESSGKSTDVEVTDVEAIGAGSKHESP